MRERTEGKMRQVYLVAPNLFAQKRAELQALNVEYVDASAEILLKTIGKDLNDNICRDMENNVVPSDIAKEFFAAHGISLNVQYSGSSLSITGYKPARGRAEQHVEFKAQLLPTANTGMSGTAQSFAKLPWATGEPSAGSTAGLDRSSAMGNSKNFNKFV